MRRWEPIDDASTSVGRRRKAGALRPFLGFGFAVLIAVVVATVGAPTALAGPPPPSTVGPLLQITPPASGRAAAKFTANYWYVDPFGAKCFYTSVDFSWDGKLVATAKVDPPDPTDLTYCSVTHVFARAPTAAPGRHVLSALACFINGSGARQCDKPTLAGLTYIVLPTPTIGRAQTTVWPRPPSRLPTRPGRHGCSVSLAQFFWDGAAVGGQVRLDPTTCSGTLNLAKAPSPNGSGSHAVTAEGCVGARCLPATGPAPRTP